MSREHDAASAAGLRGPVLVGTDLSPESDEALRQGAKLAKDLGSRLLVCHVVPELLPDGSVFGEFRSANLAFGDSVLASARAAVEQQVLTVLGADAPAADVILESGTPHVGLLRQVEKNAAGVVVIQPGAAALDVGRHATAAVLISRGAPHGPVVAATDFSDVSIAAVNAAAAEARRRNVPLHVLHAFDAGLFAISDASASAMPYLLGSSPIALEGLDNLSAVAQQRLDDTLASIHAQGTGVIVHGRAVQAIVQYAESINAELIVVGTHGRSGLARLTLGSTAASVAESAPCSVLVVR